MPQNPYRTPNAAVHDAASAEAQPPKPLALAVLQGLGYLAIAVLLPAVLGSMLTLFDDRRSQPPSLGIALFNGIALVELVLMQVQLRRRSRIGRLLAVIGISLFTAPIWVVLLDPMLVETSFTKSAPIVHGLLLLAFVPFALWVYAAAFSLKARRYFQASPSWQKRTSMTEEKSLEGLGGWLVLVGLGIIISPLRIIGKIFPVYSEMFSNGSWAALTTPGTEAYNPLWTPILSGEMVINGGLVLAWIFIAFLFFSKKSVFPKWYIGILLFTLVFILIDALVIKTLLPNEPVFDPETIKEVGRSLVVTLIWVPYILVSKRVKATFVK